MLKQYISVIFVIFIYVYYTYVMNDFLIAFPKQNNKFHHNTFNYLMNSAIYIKNNTIIGLCSNETQPNHVIITKNIVILLKFK